MWRCLAIRGTSCRLASGPLENTAFGLEAGQLLPQCGNLSRIAPKLAMAGKGCCRRCNLLPHPVAQNVFSNIQITILSTCP